MLLIQAINKIQEISALQRNVNFVSAEDVYEAMALPNIDYGAMVFNQTSYHYDIDLGLNRLSFRLFYIDRLTDDESNKLEIQSIGFEVLKEVIKGMNSLSLNPAKGLVFRPFTQKFKDMCAGAYVEMTVEFYDEWTCPDDGYTPLSYDADYEEIIAALENEVIDLKFANSGLEQQIQELYNTFQNGMIDIEFDSNGEYNAEDFGASGFRTVEVNVPASGGGDCQESYDEGFADGYERGNDEGYNEGYSVGHNDGYDLGHSDGRNDGYNLGFVEGQETGFNNGFNEGWNNGYNQGFTDGQNAGGGECEPRIYTSDAIVDMVLNQGFTGEVLVKGQITSIDDISTQYNNATYYLGTLKVYRGNYFAGESFVTGSELNLGDWVIVRGNASNYKGNAQIDKYSMIEALWNNSDTNYPIVVTDLSQIPVGEDKIISELYDLSQYTGSYAEDYVLNGSAQTGSAFPNRKSLCYFEGDLTQGGTRKNLDYAFNDAFDLDVVNITNIPANTSVDSMVWTFTNTNVSIVKGLENITHVSDVTGMFMNSGLQSVPQSVFGGLTRLDNTFNGCEKLYDISTLGNWDVSNVTTINGLFIDCKSLTDIDPIMYRWNTYNVIDASFLFLYCTSLTEVNLGNWVFTNLQDMSCMFKGCTSLQKVYLPSIENVGLMDSVFENCSSLTEIHLTGGVPNNPNCENLFNGVAENGTLYVLSEYADKIDYIKAQLPASWRVQIYE